MPEALTVEDWISRLPLWQQDLVCRVLDSVDPEADEFDDAVKVVLDAFDVPFEGPRASIRSFDASTLLNPQIYESPRLTKLGPLRGIGLIVENSEIPINPVGLTVVFGRNAAGKSSFVRCLKVIVGSVDLEGRPWGNVYEEVGVEPRAHLEYTIGEIEHALDSPLTGPEIQRLRGISVFDSSCAELYVDEKNVIHYVPTELLILSRLASFQMKLRSHIDGLRESIVARKPSTDDLPAQTIVGAFVRSISSLSDPAELADLASLNAEDVNRIAELRLAIASAEASIAHQDSVAALHDATQARDYVAAIRDAVAIVDEQSTATLVQLVRSRDAAALALATAIEEFNSAPIAGIGSDPWQTMWIAARNFMTAQDRHFPPTVGQECPLCLQPVEDSTAEYLQHFE